MWPNQQETADLVTFTAEIFNGKLHFLCSVKTDNCSTHKRFSTKICIYNNNNNNKDNKMKVENKMKYYEAIEVKTKKMC